MRVIYRAQIGEAIPVAGQPDPTDLDDGTRAEWEVEDNRLTALRLILSGMTLERDAATGAILMTTPAIEQAAFHAASLVANCLFVQTGIDALDPYAVVQQSPQDIGPETPEEEWEFEQNSRRRVQISLRLGWAIRGTFDPTSYPRWLASSAALASFADGLRIQSPFARYEQLYKIVKHFFEENGANLDRAVSAHASRFNPSFREQDIKHLRAVRIRSMHPRSHKMGAHLNPESVRDLKEVTAAPRLLTTCPGR